MSPFRSIGKIGKKGSLREVVVRRKVEELDAVKEQYAAHREARREKEEELRRIAVFDASMVEKMTDVLLRKEAQEKAYQEKDVFYEDITSDKEYYQKKRRKELQDAIGEEMDEIRGRIERGERIEELLQDGAYTYFDKKQVVQLITHTVNNLEKNVALKESLSVLDVHLEKAEEEDRIDRAIRLFSTGSEEQYRSILEPGAFAHFSQQDVVKRIVHGDSYFSEDLLDKALQSLQREGKLEDPQEDEDVSDGFEPTEDKCDSIADGLHEEMSEDAGTKSVMSDSYTNLLKGTDVHDDRKREKRKHHEEREHQEVDALLSEVVYGTDDVAAVAIKKDHRYRSDNALSGIDPYYVEDYHVNIYVASRAFRDLLEKSYEHITREEIAEKIRNVLKEVANDSLYVAFRRAIRDVRRKEEYGLDYDLPGEDALIRIEKDVLYATEISGIMHQWESVFFRSFFNKEHAQEFAHARSVCVQEVQRALTALLDREPPPQEQSEQMTTEEYQRGLILRFLRGVVYLQKMPNDHDEIFMKDYFLPEEIAAVLLRAVEQKEDQELYDVLSEVLEHEKVDPMERSALWARDIRQAWQSLTRKSFLNSRASQEFAEGRKRQMQAVQDMLSILVTEGYVGGGLLYGGGFGGYHGYKHTTPKEVAAIALYAIESSGSQEVYDTLMREIKGKMSDYRESYEKMKDQEKKKKDEVRERRVKRQERAKRDLHLRRRTEKEESSVRQSVVDWKRRVGV